MRMNALYHQTQCLTEICIEEVSVMEGPLPKADFFFFFNSESFLHIKLENK